MRSDDRGEAIDLLRGAEIGIGLWRTVHPDIELMSACPGLGL